MAQLIGGNNVYPSLDDCMNLVRALVNDDMAGATGTPGEGQIITDSPTASPATLQLLNSAITEMYRELRNAGSPTLIKDNYILTGIGPVFGVNGLGVPDPGTQVSISSVGYYNGRSTNGSLHLPSDCLQVMSVWERLSGSNDEFVPMIQNPWGLVPRNQDQYLVDWEWRNDEIWMNGCLNTQDVRMRYQATFPAIFGPDIDYTKTFIPVMDCKDAVAYKVAWKYSMRLGSAQANEMKMQADEQMRQLKNEFVRRSQSVDYQRQPYGNDPGFVIGS